MYSFAWLALAMKNRTTVAMCAAVNANDNAVYRGVINGIAVEDGSGKNWLVTIALTGGGVKTIFVRAE